jgi:two-component system, sensor histidine kinase PdtaS
LRGKAMAPWPRAYTARMIAVDLNPALPEAVRVHLTNVADNLQLVADLGYGDVALVLPDGDGAFCVIADARPSTAVSPFASSRTGQRLAPEECPECSAALDLGRPVDSDRPRFWRDVEYTTVAYPIGRPLPFATVVRCLMEHAEAAPGAMERAFMRAAEELLHTLGAAVLVDLRTGESFATTRHAGDGVLHVGAGGRISYASPNAVSIMRLAGVEGRVTGMRASTLPGGVLGISPIVGARGAIAVEAEVAQRVLDYRSIALQHGTLVLVEDLTEARRREQEIMVKQATIREIHHRVKNNLQTIASLLRVHARRTESDEARRALADATDRVASMALVHELLAGSDEERVDFAEAARTVVDLVRRGLVGDESRIGVSVRGTTGQVDARTATSLALAVAELVHNALEHAFEPGADGAVELAMSRGHGELVLTVTDDGRGLPAGFDPTDSANLGLAIVRALVEDDLRGTLRLGGDGGTTATIRVPLGDTA